jgi:fatty-acyl-CoA synthase
MHDQGKATTITSRFRENVDHYPEKVFVHVVTDTVVRSITYSQAWAEVQACATCFEGMAPRGIVLIFLPQGWLAIAYYIAAMTRDLIPSFMPLPSSKQDPALYWSSHKRLFEERLQPVAIITDEASAQAMSAHDLFNTETALILGQVPEIDPSVPPTQAGGDATATALLQHSSGTTGLKKGVMLSHKAVLDQVDSYAAAIQATASDVVVSWLPYYHDMGLVTGLLMPASLGQTIVLLDPFAWVVRPITLFLAVTTYAGTLCWLPNFAFEHLTRLVAPNPEIINLRSVRAFINCSEPCFPATFSRFYDRFSVCGVRRDMLQVCYAMAETTFAVCQTPIGLPAAVFHADAEGLRGGIVSSSSHGRHSVEVQSTGTPIGGVEISIRDSDGRPLGSDRVGEVWVRAPFLFSGYYNLERPRPKSADGYHPTNDRGFLRSEQVYILGRLDDLIIINGQNFHAAEIESLLNSVSAIKPGRSVVFALHNVGRASSDLVVVAEVGTNVPEDEIRRAIRKRVFDAIGIYPSIVRLVDAGWLIKTTSGKITRGSNMEKFLRAQESSAKGEEHAGQPNV